jgi:hypothetical protein
MQAARGVPGDGRAPAAVARAPPGSQAPPARQPPAVRCCSGGCTAFRVTGPAAGSRSSPVDGGSFRPRLLQQPLQRAPAAVWSGQPCSLGGASIRSQRAGVAWHAPRHLMRRPPPEARSNPAPCSSHGGQQRRHQAGCHPLPSSRFLPAACSPQGAAMRAGRGAWGLWRAAAPAAAAGTPAHSRARSRPPAAPPPPPPRAQINDISLEDYIAVKPKFAVYVPHTAGRYQKKRFRKAQCPIVERWGGGQLPASCLQGAGAAGRPPDVPGDHALAPWLPARGGGGGAGPRSIKPVLCRCVAPRRAGEGRPGSWQQHPPPPRPTRSRVPSPDFPLPSPPPPPPG